MIALEDEGNHKFYILEARYLFLISSISMKIFGYGSVDNWSLACLNCLGDISAF
jgi:hypothetical protein